MGRESSLETRIVLQIVTMEAMKGDQVKYRTGDNIHLNSWLAHGIHRQYWVLGSTRSLALLILTIPAFFHVTSKSFDYIIRISNLTCGQPILGNNVGSLHLNF